MSQYVSKWNDLKLLNIENHFIHILDEKTIHYGIHSSGWDLISFKNFFC